MLLVASVIQGDATRENAKMFCMVEAKNPFVIVSLTVLTIATIPGPTLLMIPHLMLRQASVALCSDV